MENVVETNVVENPVVEIPEVVEEAVNMAIEPVQVPTIEIPVEEQKTFLGLDGQTWKDVGVLTACAAGGALLDRAIPWAVRKIKAGVKFVGEKINSKTNGVNLTNQQAQAEQQPTEIPVPQDTTPEPKQENK